MKFTRVHRVLSEPSKHWRKTNIPVFLISLSLQNKIDSILSSLNPLIIGVIVLVSLVIDYSRVHISSDEVFSKILEKPSIVPKKMIPHMKAFGFFDKMKQFYFYFLKKKFKMAA